ncbi:LYR motif-containing protein [Aspergillus ruber CBS 135680]|uniref:Complex 1 LYR protein domain-containing protein n=1 Tax=Aspergillus ruber (strain CBS 135680) TaxID=1388766 RepID=A0A017S6P7_ASPRC|nr:uncharacterized protein EURHEDRAFT_461641 [Aspergillus ruber CBS 135680]EYE92708.1 hypothetical protein EURHEDRAFT_461641 [Aspergillus ruber CBS 135680]
MRRITAPKLSGIHRFACLALYRALLRQCAKLPSITPTLSEVKPTIQQKFHKYKSLQSPSQSLNALNAGYEALDLIHVASRGNENTIQRISTFISECESEKETNSSIQRALSKAKPVKPKSKKEQKKEEIQAFEKRTARRHPDAVPITSRPRPVVSGKRRVPILINARGVPFLRIKKPQPMNLSGALRSKLENRWRRIERRERLEAALVMAKAEDTWDELTHSEEPDTWSRVISDALTEVNDKIRESDLQNKKLARDMWNVVLAERKLASEEEKRTSNV